MANPSRTLSFEQIVLESDPDWVWDYSHPEIYEFSNGRIFYQTNPTYVVTFQLDDPTWGVLDQDVLS